MEPHAKKFAVTESAKANKNRNKPIFWSFHTLIHPYIPNAPDTNLSMVEKTEEILAAPNIDDIVSEKTREPTPITISITKTIIAIIIRDVMSMPLFGFFTCSMIRYFKLLF